MKFNDPFVKKIIGAGETQIECGFRPVYVKIQGAAGGMREWYKDMPNGHALATAQTGAQSLATTGGITITENGFKAAITGDAYLFAV